MANVNLSAIEISANGRNVKYQGRSLDKLGISQLIHDVAICKHHSCFPLWSDIYWFESTKLELVDYLRKFIGKSLNN